MTRLRRRLRRHEGFTLAELAVVVAIIGILITIAVPLYLGFRDKANNTAADANAHTATVQQRGDDALAP